MRHPVIHIVKRFGRVGGMESYVWYLVHGLAEHGIDVAVICERICEAPSEGILVLEVEVSPEKPRWKSMISFRALVDKMIRERFSGQCILVHSHERSLCHQVTTFHGPPIEPRKGLGCFSRFNRRIKAWQQMERDELFGPNVQVVLPVSSKIRSQLIDRYPKIVDKQIDLAWPGVCLKSVDTVVSKPADIDQVRFIFVGKEWNRKGLDIALRIVSDFRKHCSRASLAIFGPSYEELPKSITRIGWVVVEGWVSQIPWHDFDILIHPAKNEPFGMVVSEARNHGLPVLMSSMVGAVDLNFSHTKVVEVDASISSWVDSALVFLSVDEWTPENKWSWVDLIQKHIEVIYPQVKLWVP